METTVMEKRDHHRIMNNDLLLPSDLWLDIFLRLSVADVLSLKAVCETFHQLISSDLFDETQLEDFTKQPSKAIIVSTDSNLIFDPEKRKISVWHNESRFEYLCQTADKERLHVLHDPHAINSHCHRVLDSCLGYHLVQICDRLCLCNPIKSRYHFLPSLYGFPINFGCWKIGYDDVSEKYKLFGLKVLENKVCLYVFVVARRHGKLRLPKKTTTILIGAGLDDQKKSLIKGGFLKNGNVHWLIVTEEAQSIVSVNVATEEVKARNCDCTPFGDRSNSENFFAANGTFYMSRSSQATNYFKLWVLEGVESENPNPNGTMMHENPNPNPKWTMTTHAIRALSILSGPYIHARTVGVFGNKVLMKNLLSQQYYQYDLTKGKYEKVMLERGDDTERKLIGNYTKSGMSWGALTKKNSWGAFYDIAQDPLGFIIPSNLV